MEDLSDSYYFFNFLFFLIHGGKILLMKLARAASSLSIRIHGCERALGIALFYLDILRGAFILL